MKLACVVAAVLFASTNGHVVANGSSITDTGDYDKFLHDALSSHASFAAFRSHPVEMMTLEHVTPAQGEGALIVLRQNHPEYLTNDTMMELFARADRIGKPHTASYAEFSQPMAPTTVRYIKQVADMESLFGSLDGLQLAEIGVGYGGLSHAMFSRFQLAGYTYVDLPMVERLATKFITKSQGKAIAEKTHKFNSAGAKDTSLIDLCISNYALSELMPKIADQYLKTVLPRCQRGYVSWNRDQGLDWDVFAPKLAAALKTQVESFTQAPEVPQTTRGNFVLVWDKTNPNNEVESSRDAWIALMNKAQVADRQRRRALKSVALRGGQLHLE